jgi:L-amino acid N-acyltransferase YncA
MVVVLVKPQISRKCCLLKNSMDSIIRCRLQYRPKTRILEIYKLFTQALRKVSHMNTAIVTRVVTLDDVSAINAIYGENVLHGTASWELIPPDESEMRRRMQNILAQGYPYFVAEIAGRVIGYSYASSYRPRPGYRFTVENSIYVDNAYQRRGIARQLMHTLIDVCTVQGFRQMIAVIGDSENIASIELHRSLGFVHVGLLPTIGFKHNRWLDSVLLQRILGEGDATLPVADAS